MSNPNNRPGYRQPDPRLSQQYSMRSPTQQPQPHNRGPRVQSYGMDQIPSSNRPRPPPHQQQQSRSRQSNQQQPQGYQYQSSRQSQMPVQNQRMPPQAGARPMRPPGHQQHPMVPGAGPAGGQGPYRRVSMNRSRSLSRPERQRPRQGMIRSPSQQQRMQQQGRYYAGPPQQGGPNNNMRPRPNPMPNRLQSQLQQQKMYQQQEALLNQPQQPGKKVPEPEEEKVKVLTNWWAWVAFLMTCCIPNWFLRVCLRKRNAMVQQAWREKLSLCYIIFLLCGALAFITYGLNQTLCPTPGGNSPFSRVTNGVRIPVYYSDVRVFGQVYPMDVMKSFFANKGLNLTNDYENTDISSIFNGDTRGDCAAFDKNGINTLGACALVNPYGGGLAAPNNTCFSLAELQRFYRTNTVLGFDWQDLNKKLVYGHGLALVGDSGKKKKKKKKKKNNIKGKFKKAQIFIIIIIIIVLNFTKYLNYPYAAPPFGQDVDIAIRNNLASDLSYALLYSQEGKDARRCLMSRYKVGIMETETGGCIASSMIMSLMLVVIVAMIVIRYSMALLFQWFIARRLTKPGGRSNWLAWRSIKGGNDDPANHIPGPYNNYGQMAQNSSSTSLGSGSSSRGTPVFSEQSSAVGLGGAQSDIVTTELYTVLLVTCYSEGEEGLRITMDSLAETTYSKKHKV
jgi:chitin synthase